VGALKASHPRPDVSDLCGDNSLMLGLGISIPLLPRSVYDSTLVALEDEARPGELGQPD